MQSHRGRQIRAAGTPDKAILVVACWHSHLCCRCNYFKCRQRRPARGLPSNVAKAIPPQDSNAANAVPPQGLRVNLKCRQRRPVIRVGVSVKCRQRRPATRVWVTLKCRQRRPATRVGDSLKCCQRRPATRVWVTFKRRPATRVLVSNAANAVPPQG